MGEVKGGADSGGTAAGTGAREGETVTGDHVSLGEARSRTSLVVQWLRICLPTQKTWVSSLVQEDPTRCGAAETMCHNH